MNISDRVPQAIDMFRERLSHYGMTTIVAPGQVLAFVHYASLQTVDADYATPDSTFKPCAAGAMLAGSTQNFVYLAARVQ